MIFSEETAMLPKACLVIMSIRFMMKEKPHVLDVLVCVCFFFYKGGQLL